MMKRVGRWFLAVALLSAASLAAGTEELLDAAGFRLLFDGRDGLTVAHGARTARATRLWSVQFADRKGSVDSETFFGEPWGGRVTAVREGSSVRLEYRGTGLSLDVAVAVSGASADWTVAVLETSQPIERVMVPAGLSFPLEGLTRLVFPQRGAECHGYAFLPDYFREHRPPNCHYGRKVVGPKGYEHLYGGPLRQLADHEPTVPLSLTEEGRALFGPAGEEFFRRPPQLRVNRPPAEGQSDLTLVDSACGAALSGRNFGGKGWLMRFGSSGDGTESRGKGTFRMLFGLTMRGFYDREPARFNGRRLGIIRLRNGRQMGSWTPMSTLEWRDCLLSTPMRQASRAEVVELESVAELRQALRDPAFALILNPYGEEFPCEGEDDLLPLLDEVRRFVRDGGFWWECGGYSFYLATTVEPYTSFGVDYPSAVADFAYADYGASGVALYGVQPVLRRPWDRERVVTPSRLTVAGRGDAAEYGHGWHVLCEAGETWRSPVWRMDFAHSDVRGALSAYAAVTELGGSLEAKVPDAALRERLKGAVLVRLGGGTAERQTRGMESLPPHSLVHYTEYLHGGFDKQYPDHVPVRASWGTDDDFRQFLRRGRAMGHLMMPYTNTSWWCIGPKGPTFEREGEEPLNRQRDGRLRLERYARNEGYSLCFWHPAVQAAHRLVRRQMTEEFPSDVLFQDQVGARGWVWNYHPLEPRRASGHDGMHSLTMEDAQVVPMATEDGYDRVLNFETMICGAAWGMIPSDGKHRLRHARYLFPKGEWQFFPILGYLAHGQCLFTTHDLGHFTNNEEKLAATLAFGYGLSLRWDAGMGESILNRTWLGWLDALQKSVCAAYAGQPLLDFRYLLPDREPSVLYARYGGDVTAVVNCGSEPVPLRGLLKGVELPADELAWLETQTLCGYGFYIRAPKARAGYLDVPGRDGRGIGFALREADGQVRGAFHDWGGVEVAFPAPQGWAGRELALASQGASARLALRASGKGLVTVTLPHGQALLHQMPAALASSSPRQAGHGNRVLVVRAARRDLESYQRECDGLLASLRERLAGSGLEVVEQTDLEELARLLREEDPARRPFAVLMPGGEWFMGPASLSGPQMLALIKSYVDRGGIWWCSGGYPFDIYGQVAPDGIVTQQNQYTGGASMFGIVCPTGPIPEPSRVLKVTEEGRRWFDEALIGRIQRASAPVQRPFLMETGVVRLVEGDGLPYVAAIRGDGWGYLFSMGGFGVSMELMGDVAAGALRHLYGQPWERPGEGVRRVLWPVAGK